RRSMPERQSDDFLGDLLRRVIEARRAAAMRAELLREQLLGGGAKSRPERLGRGGREQAARLLAANVPRRRPRGERASRATAELARRAQRGLAVDHAGAGAGREQPRGLAQAQAEERERAPRRAQLGS